MHITYTVPEEYSEQKLKTLLQNQLNFSSRLCRKLRSHEAVKVNGELHYMKDPVSAGDCIEVNYTSEDEVIGKVTNPYNLEIAYEDEWLLVVNKPALLPTHPRFPGDPALTTILSEKALHAANRLDTGTSGLVILTKNAYAHDLVSKTPIKKIYLALLHGKLKRKKGFVDAPIGRMDGTKIFRKVRTDGDGKKAKTYYRNLAEWNTKGETLASLEGFLLATGRTHQIRVHMQYLGHPLVGDQAYGWEQTFRSKEEPGPDGKTAYYLQADFRNFKDPSLERDFLALSLNRDLRRQFLHAYILEFTHPISGEKLILQASLPEDLSSLLHKLQVLDRQDIDLKQLKDLLEIEVQASVTKE